MDVLENKQSRGRKRFLDKNHPRKYKDARGTSPDWIFKVRHDKRIENIKQVKLYIVKQWWSPTLKPKTQLCEKCDYD